MRATAGGQPALRLQKRHGRSHGRALCKTSQIIVFRRKKKTHLVPGNPRAIGEFFGIAQPAAFVWEGGRGEGWGGVFGSARGQGHVWEAEWLKMLLFTVCKEHINKFTQCPTRLFLKIWRDGRSPYEWHGCVRVKTGTEFVAGTKVDVTHFGAVQSFPSSKSGIETSSVRIPCLKLKVLGSGLTQQATRVLGRSGKQVLAALSTNMISICQAVDESSHASLEHTNQAELPTYGTRIERHLRTLLLSKSDSFFLGLRNPSVRTNKAQAPRVALYCFAGFAGHVMPLHCRAMSPFKRARHSLCSVRGPLT